MVSSLKRLVLSQVGGKNVMMKKRIAQTAMILIFCGISSHVLAGGLYLYEIGTEDIGLANAGVAARAQDASIIAGNPAGMTRLDGSQLTVGAQALYGDFDYKLDDAGSKDPGNVVGWLPGGSAFCSYSLNDDLKLGVALYGNFGLSLDFGDNWAGHNLVKEATLMGLTLQPSMAYRINSKWSIGAGLGINYGIFSLTRDKLADGREVELDDTDVAPNAKLGILFEPRRETRFGVAYTSKVDYDFDVDAGGTLPITNTPWTLPIDASVGAPQQVMASVVQVLGGPWSILGNIGWQDWSAFSETEITIGSVTQSSKLNLQDTWHGALGAQYQMTPGTRLNFGIAYDTSMYEDQNETSFTLPSGAVWRFGAGIQRQLDLCSSLGAAVEYATMEDACVATPSRLSGTYGDPQMYFLSINYSYHF